MLDRNFVSAHCGSQYVKGFASDYIIKFSPCLDGKSIIYLKTPWYSDYDHYWNPLFTSTEAK